MLFLRIAKQYTSLPSPFVLFIWLSTILSATRRCDDLQHIFFRAHYIRSVIRINSGKISDMGTISDFHPAVNRHPSQIPGRFFYMYHLLSRQCQGLAQARTLALCSRKSKRRQPMPTIHSLPPYAQPFRLSIFHFKRLLRLPLLRCSHHEPAECQQCKDVRDDHQTIQAPASGRNRSRCRQQQSWSKALTLSHRTGTSR